MRCTLFLNALVCFLFVVCAEKCHTNDGTKCEDSEESSHRYSKEKNEMYRVYMDHVAKARSSYKVCNATTCGGCHFSVIERDLKIFKNGITADLIKGVKTKGTKYQIIKGRLYRERSCMFPARCSGIEYFLGRLKSSVPDLEIIVNTRDWPQVPAYHRRSDGTPPGPVFSFSKTADYDDVMFPAWSFWEGGPAIGLYPRGIGDWEKHRKQIAAVANKTFWNSKDDRAFFRGSRTSAERDALVLLSREFPNLVDAQYTKNQAWKSEADTLYAPPATEVSFVDHCKYKYLFNFRGVAASFRFKHVLLCKSLVFHVGDDWLEFFYPALVPWIHYVPVDSNADKKKLKVLIEFFKNNEEYARAIASEGFNFAWRQLKNDDVLCYWKRLLTEYAKLLKFAIVLDGDFVEIK